MADPFAPLREPELAAADERLLAVRKPIRMHTAPGRSPDNLCAWVFARFPEAARCGRAGEGGLLHRLDYETSGLVLFARDEEAFAFLRREQEAGRLLKEYVVRSRPSAALQPAGSRPPQAAPRGVEPGAWEAARSAGEPAGLASLLGAGRAAPPRIESSFKPYGPGAARVACLGPDEAKPGAAAYATEILEARAAGGLVELRASLDRGFRHQIRAHLAWIGLPILGDPLYGGAEAERLYLHAARLRFVHPGTGLEQVIE